MPHVYQTAATLRRAQRDADRCRRAAAEAMSEARNLAACRSKVTDVLAGEKLEARIACCAKWARTCTHDLLDYLRAGTAS